MPATVVKSKDLVSPLESLFPGIVHKESITFPRTDNLSIGYFKVDPGTALEIDIPFEEVDFIIEGSLTISDETGNTYTAEKGDILYISKGSQYSASTETGFAGIYIIHPYNWRELLAEKT
jgi:ethanolamine utilization protein EutQ (cupin superfamily)